jgi:tetratricopeptide (TPR) repeat protein
MPLGLELAAAWLELLPPSEIIAEIKRSLDFLETDQEDVPDRQRSIRAVFESSWKLLNQSEKESFLRLCVFVGSFCREAAQQVSGASLRTLLALSNKSWLQQRSDGRFELHELMRQYGLDRLQEEEAGWQEANERHAAYYWDFIIKQSRRMQGPEQLQGVEAIQAEFGTNIKAAWAWEVIQHKRAEGVGLVAVGFLQFAMIRGRMEDIIPWMREARAALDDKKDTEEMLAYLIVSTLEIYLEESAYIKDANPIDRLKMVWTLAVDEGLRESLGPWYVLLAAMVYIRKIDLRADQELAFAVDLLRKSDEPWLLGICLFMQAGLEGEFALDEGNLLEAAEIFKGLGVYFERGLVAEQLGALAFRNKRPFEEISGYFKQAKQFYEKLNPNYYLSVNWIFLTGMYFQFGEHERGFQLHHEVQKTLEQVGNSRLLALSYHWEGLHAVRFSTYEHTMGVYERSLKLTRKTGSQSDLCWKLFELGDVYRVFGEREKAQELYTQAYDGFDRMNFELGMGYYQRALGDLAVAAGQYSAALEHYQQFDRHVIQDNHKWSMAQAGTKLALVHAWMGNLVDSRQKMARSLADSLEWGELDLTLQAILAETVCLVKEEKKERAIELAAFITNHKNCWNETRQQAKAILDSASEGIPEAALRAAVKRGEELTLKEVAAGL